MLFLFFQLPDSSEQERVNLVKQLAELKDDGLSLFDKFSQMLMEYAPKFFLGIAILYFGFKLVNRGVAVLNKVMQRNNFDEDLRPFLTGITRIALKFLLILPAAELIGVETASFIALLAATGFAVGLAFQGSLSNFAGGILILFFKPFRTGDLIVVDGYTGTVKEIQLLYTVLETLSHRRVIIPNSILSNGVVENISGAGIIRMDVLFGISYSDDIDKARRVIMEVIGGCPYAVNKEGYPHEVLVHDLGDSSVNMVAWVWIKGEHYWETLFYMQEWVKKAFDKNGVTIPFPQRDVHLHQGGEQSPASE